MNLAEPLNIVVCLAQVLDPGRPIQLDVKSGAVRVEDDPDSSVLDPRSEFALEMALRLKKETGAAVRAVTLGPERAERMLRRALAAGADAAVRVWDSAFEGGDSLFKARLLGAAVGNFWPDIVLCGSETAEGGSGFVGAALAAELRFPYLPGIREMEPGPDSKFARVRCRKKTKVLTYECALPALFTLGHGRSCPPAPLKRIRWANREEIPVLDSRELNISPSDLEGMRSGIRVVKTTHPKPRDKRGLGVPPELPPIERYARVMSGGLAQKEDRVIIEGSSPAEAEKLFDWLAQEKIVSL